MLKPIESRSLFGALVLWLWWIIANFVIVSLVAGLVALVGFAWYYLFFPAVIPIPVIIGSIALVVILGGAITGLLQILILRLGLGVRLTWIGATILGWVVSAAALVILNLVAYEVLPDQILYEQFYGDSLNVGLAGIVFGGAVGLSQWLVLRREFKYAYVWILTSMAGYLCAASVLVVSGGGTDLRIVLLAVAGATIVLGMVTGLGVVFLLCQPGRPARKAGEVSD